MKLRAEYVNEDGRIKRENFIANPGSLIHDCFDKNPTTLTVEFTTTYGAIRQYTHLERLAAISKETEDDEY